MKNHRRNRRNLRPVSNAPIILSLLLGIEALCREARRLLSRRGLV
jgi:hypothetical protein